MGVGRILTIISTTVVMLLGLTLIGGGAWLATRGGGVECIKYFQFPLFGVGAVLFIFALIGFLGAVLEFSLLLYVYLLLTFCAIVVLAVFTGMAFVATNSAVKPISAIGYSTYRVPDFSNWLQSFVNTPEKWEKLSACIRDSNVCAVSMTKVTTPGNVYDLNWSPVQAGCCLRPESCNPENGTTGSQQPYLVGLANDILNYTMGTNISSVIPYLSPPGAPPSNVSVDCQLFKPEPLNLCFPCETCKAGLLKSIQDSWRTIAFVNLTILGVLVVVYIIGCCALHSARRHGFVKLCV